MLLSIDLPGLDGRAHLAYEESLFADVRQAPRPVSLFYVNAPCVVLGRGNAPAQWVNEAACAADGIPVLRRFSGGGTVYHDEQNLNYSFIVPRRILDSRIGLTSGEPSVPRYIAFFRRLVIRALERGGQGGYSESGISDITLHGQKISGNAQRIAQEVVLHHGTLMLRCPLEAIEHYLPVPPNRPGVPHRGFLTGLHEQGRQFALADIKSWLATEFAETLKDA